MWLRRRALVGRPTLRHVPPARRRRMTGGGRERPPHGGAVGRSEGAAAGRSASTRVHGSADNTGGLQGRATCTGSRLRLALSQPDAPRPCGFDWRRIAVAAYAVTATPADRVDRPVRKVAGAKSGLCEERPLRRMACSGSQDARGQSFQRPATAKRPPARPSENGSKQQPLPRDSRHHRLCAIRDDGCAMAGVSPYRHRI